MAGREKRKRRRKERRTAPVSQAGDARPGTAPQPSATVADAPRKSKNDIARQRLEPLAEGERPTAVTVAAVVAALIALANAIAAVVGGSDAAGAIPFAIGMAIAATGMWYARYWAVLGFQVILAIAIVASILSLLLVANDVLDFAISAVTLAGSGTLFWFLVKSLARLQMPDRRPPASG